MTKRTIVLLIGLVFWLYLAKIMPIQANEGRISLKNEPLICEGVSIWEGSKYSIFGRCQGLTYPYSSEYDEYVLWVKEDSGAIARITEIQGGIFEGQNDNTFTNIFITAEKDRSPKSPTNIVVASGDIAKFDFRKPVSATIKPIESTIIPSPAANTNAVTQLITPGRVAPVIALVVIVIIIVFILRR